MAFWKIFDKLDDVLYEPVKLVTDWAHEPLKRWDESRKTDQQKLESEIRNAEREHEVNLEVRRKKALAEIEELRRNEELSRMERVSEAIAEYQKRWTNLNVAAIEAIGNMQLGLRERAHDLMLEKAKQYGDLQHDAFDRAKRDLKEIDQHFPDGTRARDILERTVDEQLANIVDTASEFVKELNNDISRLNEAITRLADRGQEYMEQVLSELRSRSGTPRLLGNPETPKRIGYEDES